MSEVFKTLSNVDISTLTDKKGNFHYLSWSNAVREASKLYPKMSWDFTKWDNLPYLQTETGFYVECAVTIEDVTRTQMMPVLNHKNQTDMKPNANAINKSQMRALAKAIALHGLGLDLWAGEDINGDYDETGMMKVENLVDGDQVLKLCELFLDESNNPTNTGQKIIKAYKINSFNELSVDNFNKIMKDTGNDNS